MTGFFGQNFDWLVSNIQGPTRFLVLGIGGLLIPLVALWAWLCAIRRRESQKEAEGSD